MLAIFKYRELILIWIYREIRSRYRQSALGLGWAIVQPLVQIVVISVIFGNIIRVPTGDTPYPVFAYVAILPWTFFSGAVSAAVPSLVNSMDLLTKIYFPREILPISAILARVFDLAIAGVIYIALITIYKIPLFATILYVPLIFLLQLIFIAGIGLLGAAISVFLRDISYAVPIGMQLWMYLTPVIYPIDLVPEQWRSIYMLNPMAVYIQSYRQVVLDGTPPQFEYLALAGAISIIIFIFGYYYFKRLEMAMTDII